MTDLLAKSFLTHFDNALIGTLETVRTPHLSKVLTNLRNFAARVPAKYRKSIDKAFVTDGILSFLLKRASVSLLVAKATMRRSADLPVDVSDTHIQLATVVEELYIAAMLHGEDQWDQELKDDGKSFMAVAMALASHLTGTDQFKRPRVLSALFGVDAKPDVLGQYGLDLLSLSVGKMVTENALKEMSDAEDRIKVSLLGGDSLYATAQWIMANLDSPACRKVIARTIASFSDAQLVRRECTWEYNLSLQKCLDVQRVSGEATFFSTATQCAAILNNVGDEVATELAQFGADFGLIFSLLKSIRHHGIREALRSGHMTAPVLFAVKRDPELTALLERRLNASEDLENSVKRVFEHGVRPTLDLIRYIGQRAVARLECLEDSQEKKVLASLTRGIACLPEEAEVGSLLSSFTLPVLPLANGFAATTSAQEVGNQLENIRLQALNKRLRSAAGEAQSILARVNKVALGGVASDNNSSEAGLGIHMSSTELDWLVSRGLNKRASVPQTVNLDSLLLCVRGDVARVRQRLLNIGDLAESQKLKRTINEVFTASAKHLRPALCLLIHQLLVQNTRASNPVLVLATAIEVIHTASLVHDDVLDDADTRRQQQTTHRVFGKDVAVLSGDFLFATGVELVESLERDEISIMVSRVLEEFGEGELSQGARRFDLRFTVSDYLRKSFYKTGSLLAAACRATTVLSESSGLVADAMYSYGFYLGMAFQISDDVLDYTGSVEKLGKPANCADLKEGYLTAPLLLCIHGSEDLGIERSPDAAELCDLVQRKLSLPGDFQRAGDLVRQSGGIEKAYALAEEMSQKALEALTFVAPKDSDARRALAGLTRWAVRRGS